MTAPIKLYFDFLSQPSRALYILFKMAKVPYESCPVALRNGAHLTEEFKSNVNRFQKVPCIVDNDFKLSESVAIVRYLKSTTKHIPDSLYPSDIKAQARVDEYLEWQHNNTRMLCATYFQLLWLLPRVFGKEGDPKQIADIRKRMEACLDQIENIWLAGGKRKYLVGDQLSVADIFGVCEIEQTRLTGYDATVGRPNLSAWWDRVKKETNPYFDEANKIVDKLSSQAKL